MPFTPGPSPVGRGARLPRRRLPRPARGWSGARRCPRARRLLRWSSSRIQPRSTARGTSLRADRGPRRTRARSAPAAPPGAAPPGAALDAAPSVATAITPSRARRRSTASGAPCLSASVTTVLPQPLLAQGLGRSLGDDAAASMIITRRQMTSTSGRMWVERITCARGRGRGSGRGSQICLGSRPTVGSSRINTSGSCTIALARPTRWR